MYPPRVKVRKKDFALLAGKQQKCRGKDRQDCVTNEMFKLKELTNQFTTNILPRFLAPPTFPMP